MTVTGAARQSASLSRDTAQLAQDYDRDGVVQFSHGLKLIENLKVRPGERVLDIGTGTGRLAEFVARIVGPEGQVVGIDPLPERIAIARRRASDVLSFDIGQAENLSRFAPASFDVVYLNSVFHWIDDKSKALTEITRVLCPGGRLGLTTKDVDHPHQSSFLIQRALASAGLDVTHDDGRGEPGIDSVRLAELFAVAGFADYSSELITIVDHHANVDDLLRWCASSAFGNFLADHTQAERWRIRGTLAGLLERYRTTDGIRLERYLRYATARFG